MIESRERIDPSQLDLKDTVVNISRVTKVVKGGKNLSFSALVVADDDQRAEAQVLAALDHLGNAADVDDRILQVQLRRVDALTRFNHVSYQLPATSCQLPDSSWKLE